MDSFRGVRLTLWDENEMKLVSFAAASSLTVRSRQANHQPNGQER